MEFLEKTMVREYLTLLLHTIALPQVSEFAFSHLENVRIILFEICLAHHSLYLSRAVMS